MGKLYREYFNIDPKYYAAVTADLIEQGKVSWKGFLPHETFVKLLEVTYKALSGQDPRSIWVEGAYGTGKSHAALTVKSILDASDEEVIDYFNDFGLRQDLRDQYIALKNSGKILTIHRVGSAGIDTDLDLILAVQQSIMAALKANGIENHGDASMKDAFLRWMENPVNRDYFEALIRQEKYAWTFAGATAQDVVERLNTGSDKIVEATIHTLSFDGELMLTILAGFAQEESKSASDNQKWRIRHAYEQGEVMCWRRLYGYRIKRRKVEIQPEEAAIVREAFARVIAGESLSSIAKDMEQRGLPRPMGGEWTHLRIRDMIRNEKYLGDTMCQKYLVVDHLTKRKKKNEGELPKYYIEGNHDPIIDKETFMRANAVMDRFAEAASKRPHQRNSAFTGMILCTNCGKNYCRASNGPTKIWNCRSYKQRGPSACPAKQIHEDTLYAITTEVLGLEEFDPAVFQAKISSMRVEAGQTLVYCFYDGHEVKRTWVTPSRRDSWSPEMKEKARQRYLARKGEHDAESNSHSSDH